MSPALLSQQGRTHVCVCACVAAYVRHQLQLLENKLTLGQAMVYRSMVALRYSKQVQHTRTPTHAHQTMLVSLRVDAGDGALYLTYWLLCVFFRRFFVRHPDSYQRTVLVLDMLAIFAHALPFVKSSGDTAKKKNGGACTLLQARRCSHVRSFIVHGTVCCMAAVDNIWRLCIVCVCVCVCPQASP